VRRAWAERPGWNAWTFARWDIWAGWRLAYLELHGDASWQEHVALWEEGGEVVAAALVGESATDGVLLCLPSRAELVPRLLAWLEPRGLTLEARAANAELGSALRERGWEVVPGGFHRPREKALGPHDEEVALPPGLRLEELEDDRIERYNVAVRAAFGHVGGSPEEYAVVRRGPSAVHELGLVAVDGDGRVVSFAETWLDRDNLISEYEPVGTIPELQKRGIASALMRESENRLRRLGCRLATVHSWSTMEGANRLYESLGYRAVDRQEVWAPPSS